MSEHLIIVGAGQAAAQAVQTLTQNAFCGSITVIGEENHLPYQRPPLSKKYLAGELRVERLTIRPRAFYEERRVRLRLGVGVAGIDRHRGRIELMDGEVLGYDWLMLATGSRVRELRVPGAALRGVHYLRGIEDADRIARELAAAERLVVIGAGYIGLEVAAVARSRGRDVKVLEAADRAMARVVSPEVSRFYADVHRAAGVDLRFASSVRALLGKVRVEAVETDDGERHPCDLVVVGIGIEPATALAEDAGLACDNGIVVDAVARSSEPSIVAAGDCTSQPSTLYERRIRLESVHNAIEQGKVAAMSALGRELQATEQVPWFWSDQYDLKLQIAGLSQGYDALAVRGSPQDRHFAAYYAKAGRLIAVDAVNSPKDFLVGKKLIAARASVDLDAITMPDADLDAVAAAALEEAS